MMYLYPELKGVSLSHLGPFPDYHVEMQMGISS